MLRQAVILAGGKGTRLGALTATTPKPLLKVAGRPFIAQLIDQCRRHGICDIVVLTGPFKAKFQEVLGDGERYGVTIRYVPEPEPAGTAGALGYAADDLDQSFLMLNGDSFFDINLLDLALGPKTSDWEAHIGVRALGDAGRFGRIEFDGESITSFAEKTQAGPGLINAGVYHLRREVLSRIGPAPVSLETDVLPVLARAGKLTGRAYSGKFIDIGVPEDLERADQLLGQWQCRPAAFLDRDGVLNADIGYLHRPEDCVWVEGAKEAVRDLNDRGYYVFVVTNQAGVARGFYDEATVKSYHNWLNGELARSGAHIDAFYYCPHHPDAGAPPYRKACECRKPRPGMILQALAEWPVDLSRSLLIGDQESDIEAGAAAGLSSFRFGGGNLRSFVADSLRTVQADDGATSP